MWVKFLTTYFLLILALPFLKGQDLSLTEKEKILQQAYDYEERSEVFSETDLDSCLFYTEKALQLYKQIEDWEGYTNMLSGLAGINYYLDDYEQAFHYNQLAIESAQRYLPQNNQSLGHALNTKGALLDLKGQYAAATDIWKKALALVSVNQGEEEYIAGSLLNIAQGYRKNGDYDEAIAYLKQAEQIYKSNNDPALSQVYNSIAQNYQLKEVYQNALDYNAQALQILENSPDGIFSQARELDILITNSKIFLQTDQIDSATYYIGKAEKRCDNNNLVQKAIIAQFSGQLFLRQKKFTKALNSYQQSLELWREKYVTNQKHPRIATSLFNIAATYQQSGQTEKAIAEFQNALINISSQFSSEDFNQNPKLDELLSIRETFPIFRQKGQALLTAYTERKNQDYLLAAFNTYQSLAQLIVKIRQSFESEESRRFLLANAHEVYEEAIEIALLLHANTQQDKYLNAAFTFAESNKAILLLDALQHHQAFGLGGLPDSLLEQESSLRTSIAFYERSILETKNRTKNKKEEQEKKRHKIQLWEKQLLNIRQEYQNLVGQIEQNYPHFYQLKYQQGAASIAAVQEKLPNEQTILLEYFLGATQVYLFVLHKKNAEVITIPNKENIVQQINNIRQIITQRPLSDDYATGLKQFQNLSHSLYQQIIQPALKARQPINLIIVPDGELNYLPFEVLAKVDGDSPASSYRGLFQKALVHQHVVSYSYSSSLLMPNITSSTSAASDPSFLGFAPSFGQQIAEDRSCQPDQLYSLECNQSEVENIQRLFSGQSFYGPAANRENFQTHFSGANILHLATHACVDEDQGNFNRIFFADGDLSNFEIKNLSLNTDLVTLSACNTGVGKLLKGEGLMSLAKSFAIAGCPSTLMSIWSVDDCATSDIMLAYYEQIRAGKSKDQALQFSKKQYLQEADKLHAHPYYWAAFIQMGNTQPLYFSQSNRSLFVLGLLGISLLIGGILFRQKQKR